MTLAEPKSDLGVHNRSKRTPPSDFTSRNGSRTIWTLSEISISLRCDRYTLQNTFPRVAGSPAAARDIGAVQADGSELVCLALPPTASTVDAAALADLHVTSDVRDDEIFDIVALFDHLSLHVDVDEKRWRGAAPCASRMLQTASACLQARRSLQFARWRRVWHHRRAWGTAGSV